MRIMVIGATGMVGSAIRRNRTPENAWSFEDHASLEVTDPAAIESALERNRPDAVINAAAFLGVDPCAGNPERACAVNSLAPWNLARACRRRDICLVQFSTDAVFDGAKGSPYDEEDAPNPLNLYGMTKHLGDLAVGNNCPRHYILRLPILFGMRENRGRTFLEKMYDLAAGGARKLRIADDVISSPSFGDDVAREAVRLITGGAAYGLYHIRNAGAASLYDLAAAFFAGLGLEVELSRAKAADFAPLEKDLKPLNTSLGSIKLKPLRPWEEAMADFIPLFRREKGR